MNIYGVEIYTKKNNAYHESDYVKKYVITAYNKTEARDIAYELYRKDFAHPLPRRWLQIEVDILL